MVDQYSFYEKFVPEFHKRNDPNKVLKAILDGVQEEHNKLRDLTTNLPTLVDLDKIPCELLPYLANHVGLQIEACDPCNLIREQIRAAVPTYKIKGTKLSYETVAKTHGFEVDVIPQYEDGPDGFFQITRFGTTKVAGNDLQIVNGGFTATSVNFDFFLHKVKPNDFIEINAYYWRIITVNQFSLVVDHAFDQTATVNFRVLYIESFFEHQAMHKDPLDFSLPTYFHNIEEHPFLDEQDAIIGFNQRVQGYHAGSRIRLDLRRSEETENLQICGFNNFGLLSNELLRRILTKLESVKPIHIELLVNFIFETTDDVTINGITDDLVISINTVDSVELDCCCFHGKGQELVNPEFQVWDIDIWDEPTLFWDELIGFTGTSFYDTGYTYWDTFLEFFTWDYFSPAVWGEGCVRDETNAFSLNRFGFVKFFGNDLQVNNSATIISPSSNFLLFLNFVIPGDFVDIDAVYYRIISVIDGQTLLVDRPVPMIGTVGFQVVWIESWHRRLAMRRDPLDGSLPEYFHDIMLIYSDYYDLDTDYDEDGIYDEIESKLKDCCNKETNEIGTPASFYDIGELYDVGLLYS